MRLNLRVSGSENEAASSAFCQRKQGCPALPRRSPAWVKAEREGRLGGAGSRPMSPQQMEIARLRAELARVKMERDILGKATAYFAKERG